MVCVCWPCGDCVGRSFGRKSRNGGGCVLPSLSQRHTCACACVRLHFSSSFGGSSGSGAGAPGRQKRLCSHRAGISAALGGACWRALSTPLFTLSYKQSKVILKVTWSPISPLTCKQVLSAPASLCERTGKKWVRQSQLVRPRGRQPKQCY